MTQRQVPEARRSIPVTAVWAVLLAIAATSTAGAQVVFNATPASLGAIPDGGTGYTPGPPRDVTFTVTGVAQVDAVMVTMTFSPQHTWGGDVTATLIAPDGTSHVVFGRRGATTATGAGSSADLAGPYGFSDRGALNFWTAASNPVTSGLYRTSQSGGAGATGATTQMDPVFRFRGGNGSWRLRLVDGSSQDTGAVSAAALTLIAVLPPTGLTDTYGTPYQTRVQVAAPGVLANDSGVPSSGTLTATLVRGPTRGTVSLNADGGFIYTPVGGWAGVDTFVYRPNNFAGEGNDTVVTVTVAPPTTVQAPLGIIVDHVAGNDVTLRWTPVGFGPTPTGYIVEGGVTPGSTVGTLAVGPVPFVRFTAPNGAFFIRVKALDGAMVSAPSPETTLHVGPTVRPTPPTRLTAVVRGNEVALSWRLRYEGGEPLNAILDVTGAAVTSIPVGKVEAVAFSGVPDGTYTFSVRAENSVGSSLAGAQTATVGVPTACSGVPLPPTNFFFFGVGPTVDLFWEPPAAGPAPTGYQLDVTGAFTGTVPVGMARRLSTAVPSGTYSVSVTALNPCGASAPTGVQTVVVP